MLLPLLLLNIMSLTRLSHSLNILNSGTCYKALKAVE